MVENIVGEQPEYIIWKKGDRMLNYDTERGGIRWLSLAYFVFDVFCLWSFDFHLKFKIELTTHWVLHSSVRTDLLVNGAQSRLHIAGAAYSDSGNYTCMMGRTARAVIELQIIPGTVYSLAGSGEKYKLFLPRRDRRAGEGRQRGRGKAGRESCGGGGGQSPPPPHLLEDWGLQPSLPISWISVLNDFSLCDH